jgi:DASS family divalent anion:Na+ symporter
LTLTQVCCCGLLWALWLQGKSTLGLAYGLILSEAAISPAMPSTTARAGGVYLPIISSLGNNADSMPNSPSARKLSAFLVQAQLQCAGPGSALFMTAAAQNMLTMKLGQVRGSGRL